MPNPAGKNQLPGGEHEIPYGGVQQQQQLTREAPMSGAPVSAVNAPRRAQRRAVKGERAVAPAQPQPVLAERPEGAAVVAPPSPPVSAPDVPSASDFWSAVASIPGVSPLAQEYAQRARNG